jgi:DNA-binding MarR family transcriptional regulator
MSIIGRLLEPFHRRARKIQSEKVLLECLRCFTDYGNEEISLPEILDSILYLKRKLPLDYDFSRDVLYSAKLFSHMSKLEQNGYIRRYVYTHDALLPISYVTLTMLGRGHAQKIAQEFSQPTLTLINDAVKTSIGQHKEYWRLYPRIKVDEPIAYRSS